LKFTPSQFLDGTAVGSQSQPYTIISTYDAIWVGSDWTLFGSASGNVTHLQQVASASPRSDAGNLLTATGVTDSVWHAAQTVYNGNPGSPTSGIYIDSLLPTTGNIGGTALSTDLKLGSDAGGGLNYNGYLTNIGIWPSAFTSGNASSMNTTLHSNCGC
jgi:hypothetical protein